MPLRPGTGPPGGATFVPPPPQLSYGGGYAPQYPPGMMPPYGRTPTPSDSPVVPSPPPRRGDGPFIPPDLGPSQRGSVAMPHVYVPRVPGDDEEVYIPPEPSYSSRTPSIDSHHRSPSLPPVPIPGPFGGPGQAPPPIFVHPASQPSPSQLDRTGSPGRSRTTPTPPPAGGQTIINMPPQTVPMAPSTQHQYDDRAGQPDLFPHPGGPQFQIPVSPRPEHSEHDDRRGTPGAPIIIHPPPHTMVPPPGPFGPPGVLMDPRPRSRSRSRSPTYSSRSTRPSREGDPMLQPMFPGHIPGHIPGVLPGPLPGFGVQPGGPISMIAPSHGPSEFRDPQMSPRFHPSRPPTRFDDGPSQPFHPPMPIPTGGFPLPPTAIHIDPGRDPGGYRPSRYGSRTPPSDRSRSPERRTSRGRSRSRTPSFDERDPRRSSPSYHPVPVGVGPGYGPGYDPGIGQPVVQPPAVTHVHAYPPPSQHSYPPRSPTDVSIPRTDREGEPLPHPFGAPEYRPQEQFPVPTGRAPSGRRPSLPPTVVEVAGHPERIHVHSPGFDQPRTASGGKYCNTCTTHLTN